MTPAEADPPEKDQSMDDILASIRRIMLDEQARLQDGPNTPAPSYAVPARPPVTNANPVLVLDASMAVRDRTADREPIRLPEETVTTGTIPSAPVPTQAAPTEAVPAEAVPPTPPPVPPRPTPPTVTTTWPTNPVAELPASEASRDAPIAVTPQTIEALLAPAAAAAASASVEALLKQLSEERLAALVPASGRSSPTIEDVVRSELRPFLKSWLDEHLPSMVERLVHAEITRLIGRSGV